MADISYVVNESLNVKGKAESVFYDKSNIPPNGSANFFQSRITGTFNVIIPHLINKDGTSLGVFDQNIIAKSTFDVACTLFMYANYYEPSTTIHRYAYKVFTQTIPAGTNVTSLLSGETSEKATDNSLGVKLVLPELRLPFPSFTLGITFDSAPTTGELILAVSRRF